MVWHIIVIEWNFATGGCIWIEILKYAQVWSKSEGYVPSRWKFSPKFSVMLLWSVFFINSCFFTTKIHRDLTKGRTKSSCRIQITCQQSLMWVRLPPVNHLHASSSLGTNWCATTCCLLISFCRCWIYNLCSALQTKLLANPLFN